MKSIIIALTLVFSTVAMAKIPATEAFNNILPAGEYVGSNGSQKCLVQIKTTADSVTVVINATDSHDGFALLNSSSSYSVNEVTGQIAATQNLSFPRYLKGGTKILNVSVNESSEIEFSISQILLDHRGNDASTYTACTLSL